MDRRGLADFLRRSRERVHPSDVGLNAGPRRRTPGLRREEVALLAGMSADYYMRLEQARSPQPSTQVLAALGRALRLTEDGVNHLHLLAGHRPPAGPLAGDQVRPAVLRLLEQLREVPAQVLGDLGDVLAQNALAEHLLGGYCPVTGAGRNVVVKWFTDPSVREPYTEQERRHRGRVHVADLRAAVARRGPGDAAATELVGKLCEESPEFAVLWREHEAGVRRASRMRVIHPVVGSIDLDCETVATPSDDQRLVVFFPPPGSTVADRLARLSVTGSVEFPGG
ncbi:MAG TPA: helix-turn-helix transcriptional regulator [Pseudonocardia sp.]|jgi:transcriptional regulator with XRE-family HTH domain|uniref:helix-turn-helix transcriptional regulator n=1 Tax=Pseudonocardia sp. TaxID=60912 RepID=UPI002B4AD3C6|nr:helix-turn-helix transcriptional regulator [Pseudonocardia sp.]HLU60008.1 helix-turn-helix transcriptional regulator [Pseudonocardia sp.]